MTVSRVIIRGVGYGALHLADVADDQLLDGVLMGRPFVGVWKGQLTLCGARPRSSGDLLVVMQASDAAVKRICRFCSRHSDDAPIHDPYVAGVSTGRREAS